MFLHLEKACQNSGECVRSDTPDPQCNSPFLNLSCGIDVLDAFQESNTVGKISLKVDKFKLQ